MLAPIEETSDKKGRTVKTLWVCVLSCLLSIVTYAGISAALSGAEPVSEAPAARSASVAEDLAEYVHLHKTRGQGSFLHGAASARACTE